VDVPARNLAPSIYGVYKPPQYTDDDLSPTTVRRNYFGVTVKILFRKKQSCFFFESRGSNRELMTAYCQSISFSLLTKYSSEYRKYVT
jgi:hypothetical protein